MAGLLLGHKGRGRLGPVGHARGSGPATSHVGPSEGACSAPLMGFAGPIFFCFRPNLVLVFF
jgi:hypothetical protein